jgi:1,4-alpha-glucan branching enzyme
VQIYDPHATLGLHELREKKIIRLWRPGAEEVHLQVFGKPVSAKKVDEQGLFEFLAPANTTVKDYQVYHHNGLLAYDPYAFLPLVGELDQHLFNKGVHYQIFKVLGAHFKMQEGIYGVHFAVWAPAAESVSLIADFNFFDGRVNPMRTMGASGIWELFVPGLKEGEKYKFEIKTKNGDHVLKADPFANFSELRPATASRVFDVESFSWGDQAWLKRRKDNVNKPYPLNIYEVHLGSWKKNGDSFQNYKEISVELADYCLEMGYTHVELMPIQEHPLDESWGYQVSGYYSVTSRFGTPADFQWFVNHMHEKGLGVILDWVPGHFPTDNFSLARFDGTALYEHVDPRQGFHPHWNTYIFNISRNEVSNFLIGNALYWLEMMHIDGLRVDAVASMLYLDYGREKGEWIPNKYGSNENLETIEFIKHLNSIVHQKFPGTLMIAEESTSFTGVTHPIEGGGLGFDLKWNMGWMNDTLRYFSVDMLFRNYHSKDLTFGLLYAFQEKFALTLSHDEVVHGKKSLLARMPGDTWQKFANLRLLLSYMITQPGKKLLFMGGEIGQWNEWNCKGEIEWFLLKNPTHHGLQTMVKEINHLYLKYPAFWESDFNPDTFQWIDFSDTQNCVISYLRKSTSQVMLCVHNFTPQYHGDYLLWLPDVKSMKEVFNSDDIRYGGSGKVNTHPEILRNAVKVHMAPLATMIFQIEV